ncbi:MAG: tetratricopeptide repeat protein [Pseudomonadota bacterium]
MEPDQWARVRRLFDQLCDLSGTEQQAALDELTDSTEVRRRVESMLAAEHDNAIKASLAEQTPSLVDHLSRMSSPGRRVGPYTIGALIGRGGMGEIYAAERSDGAYQQRVAIKLVALKSPEQAVRFERERQLLASLEHPNIARLLDGGVDPEGIPFLVMEYIDGQTIDGYCDQQRLNVARRIELFLPVIAAVSAAHQQLIVHRDIKPQNVLVDAEGQPKLIDFGIGKVLSDAAASPTITRPDDQLLTPANAAPEQVGDGAIGTHTDSFQLGLLLGELVCGVPARDLKSASMEQVVTTLLQSVPSPASRLAASPNARAIADARSDGLGSLQRQLAGDLGSILSKACAIEPTARYRNVDDLGDDLRRYLTHQPVQARKPSGWYLLSRFVRRHRAAVAASLAALLALGAAFAYSISQTREAERQRRVALSEVKKQQQVRDFLVSIFRQADPNVSRGREASARSLLETAAAQVLERVDDPLTLAAIAQAIGGAYHGLGAVEEAQRYLQQALSLYRDHGQIETEDFAATAYLLGEVYQVASNAESLDLHQLALSTRLKLSSEPRAELAESLLATARAMRHTHDRQAIVQTYDRALEVISSYAGADSADYARALGKLGSFYGSLGALETLYPIAVEAYRIGEGSMDPDDPELASLALLLGTVASDTGRFEVARQRLQQAFDRFSEVYGERHPRTLSALANRSAMHSHLGQTAEMLTLATLYRDRLNEVFGARSPKAAFGWSNLGSSYFSAGRYEEALAAFRQSIDILTDPENRGEDNAGRDYVFAGMALVRLDQPDAALTAFETAGTRVLGLVTSVLASRYAAEARLQLGELEVAESLAVQALAEAAPLNQTVLTAGVELTLARVQYAAERHAAAVQTLESARSRVAESPFHEARVLLASIEERLRDVRNASETGKR